MSDAERGASELNPYASPNSSTADFVADTSGDPRTVALRAFVGPSADRYLRKWSAVLSGSATNPGFNWAAFFLSGLWMGYRKMYRATLILYGILLVEMIVVTVIASVVVDGSELIDAFDRIVNLAVAIICGGFGNRWYLAHATRAIAEERADGLEGEPLLHILSQRGGTNLLASLGFFGLFLVAVFVVSLGIALVAPGAFE